MTENATTISPLARTVEALLFLSPDPVGVTDLVEATDATEAEVERAIDQLRGRLAEGVGGVVLREVAGGFTLASAPEAEPAARRLLSKPRTRRSPRRRPRRWRSSLTCSRCRGPRSPASAASPRSPRCRRSANAA